MEVPMAEKMTCLINHILITDYISFMYFLMVPASCRGQASPPPANVIAKYLIQAIPPPKGGNLPQISF